MSRLGGTNKIVIREIHPVRQIAEILTDRVGECLRRYASRFSGFFDLLAMLVSPG